MSESRKSKLGRLRAMRKRMRRIGYRGILPTQKLIKMYLAHQTLLEQVFTEPYAAYAEQVRLQYVSNVNYFTHYAHSGVDLTPMNIEPIWQRAKRTPLSKHKRRQVKERNRRYAKGFRAVNFS